jgi:hypothetical protein
MCRHDSADESGGGREWVYKLLTKLNGDRLY